VTLFFGKFEKNSIFLGRFNADMAAGSDFQRSSMVEKAHNNVSGKKLRKKRQSTDYEKVLPPVSTVPFS